MPGCRASGAGPPVLRPARTGSSAARYALYWAPMARSNPQALLIAGLIFAGILVLDPFGLMRGRSGLERPEIDPARVEELAEYLREHHQAPETYLAGLFDQHSVVFLGEYGRLHEQVAFVTEALDTLHAAGVSRIGLTHLLAADQSEIDELITTEEFDRTQAERLLFNRKVLWGYEQYVELLEAIWRINRGTEPGDLPLRAVGLNTQPAYRHLESPPDLENPEKMQRVFADGVPDREIADAVKREIVASGERALVFTAVEHAFTGFEDRAYAERMRSLGFAETARAGNYVAEELGAEVATVLMHAPWPDSSASSEVRSPAGGAIEAALTAVPERYRRAGLSLTEGPFGELELSGGDYLHGYSTVRLAELADGYIALGLIGEYQTVTPISSFIEPENLDEAIRRFPGPTPDGASVSGMNAYLQRVNDQVERNLELFR